MGSLYTGVPSPGVAAFIGFAFQAKLARFESAGAAAPHTPLPFGFNPGYATGSLIGRGVLSTPPFFGTFCRPVGAQSSAQHWHTGPLTRLYRR